MTTSRHLIREARLRAGLTQAQLGARSGKAHSAISRWERGEVEPSFETVHQLVRAAGFDLVVGMAPLDDHDLALIRRSLAMTPAERLSDLVAVARSLEKMVRAGALSTTRLECSGS